MQEGIYMDARERFNFDVTKSPQRHTNEKLLDTLGEFAQSKGFKYFTVKQFNAWPHRSCTGMTIIRRFGSWRKALRLIGIQHGRPFKWSPEECMDILEKVWKKLGYPPGRRKLAELGKISESPYERYWGSVQAACRLLADYHNGKINKKTLITPRRNLADKSSIPLKIRWQVLKRDKYRCVKCGRSPANDPKVNL
jgi:HNH endonuclease